MKTIKTVCGLMGAAALLAAPAAFAQLSQLYITAPGFSATGDQAGPYTVQIIGTPSTPSPIYTGADGQTPTYPNATVAFQTFCIASGVDYYPNNTYYYSASQQVQPFAGQNPIPSGTESYVTWGTAYLYNQYLKNPNAFGGPGNTAASDALQEAIWTLQDQSFASISLGGDSQSAVAGYLYADLVNATNAAAAAGQSVIGNALGAFGVEALNMTTDPTGAGGYVQPQLVDLANVPPQGSPVPEPSTIFAGALMLIPLGISAMRIMRKKTTV